MIFSKRIILPLPTPRQDDLVLPSTIISKIVIMLLGITDDKDEERVPERVCSTYYHAISLGSFQLLCNNEEEEVIERPLILAHFFRERGERRKKHRAAMFSNLQARSSYIGSYWHHNRPDHDLQTTYPTQSCFLTNTLLKRFVWVCFCRNESQKSTYQRHSEETSTSSLFI